MVLIIGYGNTLRGDDAFGPLLADRLREAVHDPEIDIRSLHQLVPELMEPISRAERVIFLDAAADGEPGEIRASPVEPRAPSGGFTHVAGPAALLAGARALYGRAACGTLVSVAAARFDLGAPLSEPVERALHSLLESTLASAGVRI